MNSEEVGDVPSGDGGSPVFTKRKPNECGFRFEEEDGLADMELSSLPWKRNGACSSDEAPFVEYPRGVTGGAHFKSIARQKSTLCYAQRTFFGGGRWIRTIEGIASRFTVCPLWPLGNSPIFGFAKLVFGGAGGRIRTPDLLITNQLLYRLSYTSTNTSDSYNNKRATVCQLKSLKILKLFFLWRFLYDGL